MWWIILRMNEFIVMCRDESLERMSDEHKLEIVVKNSSSGGAR